MNIDDMTLRDYFAAKAMHAYWSDPNVDGDLNIAAIWAYKVADAMLQARGARHARPGGQDAYRLPSRGACDGERP